jgi:deoxycytidylate deaminase
VAAGYNGFLPGSAHVSRVREGHEQATVHAEQNAIADAARRGSSVEGCVAYVTHYPCINCAKILASSGIAEIRYRQDYHNDPLVASLMADAGVAVKTLVGEGHAVHEGIARVGENVGADLIVMGSHGRRGLEKLVLGSVAQRVLQTAHVPVLVVRD